MSAFRKRVNKDELTIEGDVKGLISTMTNSHNAKSRFWTLKAAIPTRNSPFGMYASIQFFRNTEVSYIQAAINATVLSVDTSQANKACEFIRNITKFVNVFYCFRINTENWTEAWNTLKEVDDYLEQFLKADLLAVDTRLTIKNFIHIMDDLVETYPDETLKPFWVSQDPLEKIFLNLAVGERRTARSSVKIVEILEKLRDGMVPRLRVRRRLPPH